MIYNPREKGQGLIEYALILVLVAIVVIAILTALGGQVDAAFSTVNSALEQ
ncbi:MAG: Flp family type IVb pilin [Anaerolineae bacterium]|jgi:pilus assembly protein Flp/PilA|nr:Flp family type IVb pilin [Anaerolineae bacterium]